MYADWESSESVGLLDKQITSKRHGRNCDGSESSHGWCFDLRTQRKVLGPCIWRFRIFSELLIRFPAVRESLVNSRCTVRGASGRPLARGRLLHGAQRIALQHWPSEEAVLLEFESPNQQLDFLLRTECLLRPGSTRLFRVASDGLAYECRSLTVRPGQRYVLLSTAGTI